jgi:hypothetical protein
VKRIALALTCILALNAQAEGIDGLGYVAVGGGFRWLPNWWFQGKAAAAGTPVIPSIDGGPQITGSFGLGVMSWLAVSITLLGGYHGFALSTPDGGRDEYSSVTAGGLLGGRIMGSDVFFKGFYPYLDLQVGPLLAVIGGPREVIPEKAVLGLSAAGGFMWKFFGNYGVSVEARYVQARASVPGISGINVGGVWFTAMFTVFFPPAIKRDLSLPGF